jgi:hypothetical protein
MLTRERGDVWPGDDGEADERHQRGGDHARELCA